MTILKVLKIASAIGISIFLASIPTPSFAQRSGGGGFHSGGGSGGFHGGGGGGFHGGFRGGASKGPGPRGAGTYSRGSAPPQQPTGSSKEWSAGSGYRAHISSNGGGPAGASSGAPHAVSDGQWHSFAGSAAGNVRGNALASGSGSSGGEWHGLQGNHFTGAGQARSFSGQGNQIWENAPAAKNVVPASGSLSNIRGSFADSVAGNSGLRTNTLGTSRLSAGPALDNRGLSNVVGTNGFAGAHNPRFSFPFGGGRGWRGGCWNCGVGFGFGLWPGWGFGGPWLGYGGWGLGWGDPWWGWPGYAYGYPAGSISGYSYDGDYSYGAPPESYPYTDATAPVEQSSVQPGVVTNTGAPILLYMKDGPVYSVRDYWISSGQLHFILLNGVESAVEMDRLDLQRTVNENAKSGLQFTLKPGPNSWEPGHDPRSSPPIDDGSGPGAKPGAPSALPPASTPAPRLNFNSGSQSST